MSVTCYEAGGIIFEPYRPIMTLNDIHAAQDFDSSEMWFLRAFEDMVMHVQPLKSRSMDSRMALAYTRREMNGMQSNIDEDPTDGGTRLYVDKAPLPLRHLSVGEMLTTVMKVSKVAEPERSFFPRIRGRHAADGIRHWL